MDDYIKRELAIKILKRQDGNFVDTEGKWWSIGLNAAISHLEMMPAADVRPVVHGKWVEKDDDLYCSNCNHQIPDCAGNATPIFVNDNRFCYYCGAMMMEE